MYANGLGVPKEHAEAVNWYRRAADQGYASAQSNLGLMYAKGEGVPKDDAEAVKWYRSAAEQGNATAQFNLSGMYLRGEGVPQNYVVAYSWASIAAASGASDAHTRRDSLAQKMTREQIAEAQRLAANFQPKQPRATPEPPEIAAPKLDAGASGSGFFFPAVE